MKEVHPHCRHRTPVADVTEKLRAQCRKMTGPRQAILETLGRHPHPMTNKEIFQSLPIGECDLATIYRSIHLLEEMGLVQRFDFGDGVARYELVGDDKHGHHHHLICTACSEVVEIEECFPAELEQKIARSNGFKAITHKLEFFGLCPQCQTR